jgi:UDP-N-acetylmuramate--alanine ligase
MDFSELKYVYLIGIGGIGMSAVARYFKLMGKTVVGYDRTPTSLTSEMIREGISIHFNDDINNIPEEYLSDDSLHKTIVIYTPAVPNEHSELKLFRSLYYRVYKRSEILGFIAKNYICIAIAGTHGKTTITAMVAHIFINSGIDCTAFIGGITKNYNNNFLYSEKSKYIVVEADEYDRSFLKLNPHTVVISSVDADHLDIYGNKNEVDTAFNQFVQKIDPNGNLIIKSNLKVIVPESLSTASYSMKDKQSDYYALNITHKDSFYNFDVRLKNGETVNMSLNAPGLYNVENAVAAFATADICGIDSQKIVGALQSFTGIKRRFDYLINDKIVMIDDYAHHPNEIKACLTSVRDIYPDRRITGIFQPHLYTRTRDFADEFAESLDLLDNLLLLDIYPAREKPIENVSSILILDKMKLAGKKIIKKSDLPEILQNEEIDVLVIMGAGDIDQTLEPIKELLMRKYNIL